MHDPEQSSSLMNDLLSKFVANKHLVMVDTNLENKSNQCDFSFIRLEYLFSCPKHMDRDKEMSKGD